MLARLARVGMAAALAGLALIPATAAAASTAAAHARPTRPPTTTVGSRPAADSQSGPSVDAAPVATPAGFSPTSTSWPTPLQGWVLGFAPCASGECAVLMRTLDGGDTWTQVPAPPVRTSPSHDQVRVLFAERKDVLHPRTVGLVTNGLVLYATYDGGATWRSESLAGGRRPVFVGALGATDQDAYAIIASGFGVDKRTDVYRTPIGERRWASVPGLTIADNGGGASASGELGVRRSAAAVSLGPVYAPTRYWTTPDGRTWRSSTPPCQQDASTQLGETAPGQVLALCSFNPGRGRVTKQVRTSLSGAPFQTVGTAPDTGITTAFTASSGGTLAVGATGGDESFVHMSFDGGHTWETTLAVPERGPVFDLAFSDPQHGTLVCGYPDLHTSELYRTSDGGHTWEPFTTG
ncbi:sialidase family protein [Actinopolymorpha pittospori]|uniref:Photosystem II stability/assembly factor-like uncharacterized protein n=1 Tax=Actinopolymorpha pittospori TaxID=648752 RepID=A0A927RGR0_9ACTN|nr:hypothetical protein [Actinopolymorpha pittospori]MBE1611445.1 photosystem II stability/assembly factor-like uncharacterized protein [Actinopolymorpha pittospori]